jgi:phage portal protein BeeE
MSFASVSELNAMFVAYTLRPLVEKIERGLSTLVPLPNGFVKLSMDALVRGNLLDRYNAHRIAIQEGWTSIADVRRMEEMPPIDDASASAYRQPLNQADSVLAAARQKADIFAALVGAGMSADEAKKIAKL